MAEPHELLELEPILKNVYTPIRKKAFPFMNVIWAQATKLGPEKAKFSGRKLFFDVVTDRRGGFVASSAGYTPESKLAPEKQGSLGIARLYAKGQVDGLALKATQGDKGAYISLAKKVVEDIIDQWKIETSRIGHSDGLAIRALVVSKTSDTVWVLSSPYGIAGAGPGSLHLTVGDTCALHDVSALNVVLGKGKITAISLSGDNATVTFDTDMDGAGTGTAGDIICTAVPAAVSATDSSFGAEPYGFKSIMDVENAFNTFEGINDARWLAQKLTSTTIDEIVVMRLLNTIRNRSGVEWRDNPKNMLLNCSTGIWQQYGESLLGLRRFSAPEMTLKGGFTGVQVANATLYDDPWAPRGRMYAAYCPDLILVDLMDFGPVSYEDAPEWQRVTNRDAWEALYATYMNFGAVRRNSMGVISGITDTVNYSPVG